jgi:hypothetical protein
MKKLTPAYGYGNGASRVIRRATAGMFRLREMTSVYGSPVRAVVLVPS